MTTAEELQSKYNEFPAEIVGALVDEWSVKKVVVVGDNDNDPAFVFEDGSSISKGERIAYPPSRPFAE